jgi:hypothetical protein
MTKGTNLMPWARQGLVWICIFKTLKCFQSGDGNTWGNAILVKECHLDRGDDRDIKGYHGRMTRGAHGLPKISPGLANRHALLFYDFEFFLKLGNF